MSLLRGVFWKMIEIIAAAGANHVCACRLYWFAKVKYTIGGIDFSTLDMEHGVLRGNSPSPVAIPALLGLRIFSKPYFAPGHPCHSLVRLYGCQGWLTIPQQLSTNTCGLAFHSGLLAGHVHVRFMPT